MRPTAHANRLLLLTLIFVASLGFSLFSDPGSVPANGWSRFARESNWKGSGSRFHTHSSTWPNLVSRWYGGPARRFARELTEPIPDLQLDLSLADLRHTELTQWNPKTVRETVPVVFYCSEANDVPCSRGHYALRAIHQVRTLVLNPNRLPLLLTLIGISTLTVHCSHVNVVPHSSG